MAGDSRIHFPRGVLVLDLVSILFARKCSTLDTTNRLQTPLLRSRGEWGLLDGLRPRHPAVTVETWGVEAGLYICESAAVHISRAGVTSPRAITICLLSEGGVGQPILTHGMRLMQFLPHSLPMIMLRLLSIWFPRSERNYHWKNGTATFPRLRR